MATALALLGLVAGTLETLRADNEPPGGIGQVSGTPKPVPIPVPAPANRLPVRTYQPPIAGEGWAGEWTGLSEHSSQYEVDAAGCEPDAPLCGVIRIRHPWQRTQKGCNFSPDHGWSPPTQTPIVRVPVEYQRYWPTHWTGEPRSGEPRSAGEKPIPRYPTVFMPTDTTQLGYYYQRVPQWKAVNAALPPEPWPAHWHCRGCPTYRQTVYRAPIGVRQAGPAEFPGHLTQASHP